MTHQDSDQEDPVALALLGFMKCIGARDKHEVYLSTPITTGPAFITWRQQHRAQLSPADPHYEASHALNVATPNRMRVQPLVQSLRERFAERLVIDPTGLEDVTEWKQRHYRDFWCSLIERYVAIIIFSDGWQFSAGCISEFAAAIRSSAETYTETFSPLPKEKGVALIESALAEMGHLDIPCEDQRDGLLAVRAA
ncbi:MAG TPA: hypothetical protein VFQ44_05245 [Streptosporangiaceae bacterium]|nr:hypothetical protein [Streptosporangiaceae bacterium]